MGAVSTTAGAGTGSTWGVWMSSGATIFGGLGTAGGVSAAAGTRASFLGETGRTAVAAPRGLGVALAARRFFSSALSAW